MGTRQCGWCLNPYEHQPREAETLQAFRKALFIADDGFTPSICDGCFATVMESAPPLEKIQHSPNFLLRVA